MSLLLVIAVVIALCGFAYWIGWDNRGDVEETRRWDAGCRCDLTRNSQETP